MSNNDDNLWITIMYNDESGAEKITWADLPVNVPVFLFMPSLLKQLNIDYKVFVKILIGDDNVGKELSAMNTLRDSGANLTTALKILRSQGNEKFIFSSEPAQVIPTRTLLKSEPEPDPTFKILIEDLIMARVFYGLVPLSMILPFDSEYNPEITPEGKLAVNEVFNNGVNNKFRAIIVYYDSKGHWIFSRKDDYITYFANLRGQPDLVPCFLLSTGNVFEKMDFIKELQGPFPGRSILNKYIEKGMYID